MNADVEAEALYVIGTLQSNNVWNFVDYGRNISIGIISWASGEAAQLLSSLDPSDKALLTQDLQDALVAHDWYDPYWNSLYLTKDQGNSIIDALGTQTAEATQRAFFSTTMANHETVMTGWGCDPDGTLVQQKAFILLSAVYRVSTVMAARICSAIGPNATVDAIYAAIKNQVIANERNWEWARDTLNAWHGSQPADTPSTEQPNTDPGGAGQEESSIPQVESQIQRIGMTGQQLIIYGQDNPEGVVCYRQTNNFWIPAGNTAAPPTPTPIDPPAPDTPATSTEWEQMRQLWIDNEEAWNYSNGPGRLDPPASGYSDCSACIIWAVGQVRPDLADALGVWTGSMVNAGTEVARGSTGAGAYVDPDILQPGDILLVGNNYEFDNGKSHVEWYFGNGQLWGAGFSPLPHQSGDINDYLVMIASRGKTLFMIRRFLS